MIRRTVRALLLVLACLCVSPADAIAQQRIVWNRLDVEAHLDATGALTVTEAHAMAFTGDWNGGERTFNIRRRQQLELRGLWRVNGNERIALTEDAALDDVDDYAWADRQRLRWRSRLASEPPFDDTTLRYEITYVLRNILRDESGTFRLNHDFAFPDRGDTIKDFSLDLTFDPEWRAPDDFPGTFTRTMIGPGEGLVVNVPLRFVGAIPPVTTLSQSPFVAGGAWALLALTLAGIGGYFVSEGACGRFARIEADIDEAWLGAHVLRYKPEVVGAAWDNTIGTPEVLAVLARLEREGKLRSVVSDGGARFSLRLTQGRDVFVDYERGLIDALFAGGRQEITPEIVRTYYQHMGFDPVEFISSSVAFEMRGILPPGTPRPTPKGFVSTCLIAIGVALLVVAWWSTGLPFGLWLLLIPAIVVIKASSVAGRVFQLRPDRGRIAALAAVSPALLAAVATAAWLWYLPNMGEPGDPPLTTLGLAGVLSLALAVIYRAIVAPRSREAPEVIAFRKHLAAARRYFALELRKPRPALRDEWAPWLLAFGLGPQMDRWSTRHAGAPRTDHDEREMSRSDDTFGSSGSAPAWTGFGGGRSGGAGGGAAWATAAAALAAPIATPGSSSGDSDSGSSYSSSDSSSSSSGGGGGGGW